jgi:hypothetical protein
LLSPLLHAFSHEQRFAITVLTRETSVSLTGASSHSHNHHDHAHEHNHERQQEDSKITHIQTKFSESELESHLHNTDTVICCLIGSDVHLTSPVIDAASKAGTKLFIPSEYALDTSNAKIRELLPPYQTRFEIQEKLKRSGMNWKAIYSGVVLEEGLKTDGVLCIDALWASVVIFPHNKETKVALSTHRDIANSIVKAAVGGELQGKNELHTCAFRAALENIVSIVEKEIDRPLDRYEGLYEGARKEAHERMKMGYFDGGVALLGRVAVWNDDVDAWSGWEGCVSERQNDLEIEVGKAARMVRDGEVGGDGCGC